MNLFQRPQFLLDVARTELYLLEYAGAEVADRWHEALWETIRFLETHPLAGRARFDLTFTGIRSWKINGFDRWIVFYEVRDGDLILFRVVPGSLNLQDLKFS